MRQYKDETGNRYGKLVVLGYAGCVKKKATWLCRCDCGEEVIVRGNNLRTGGAKSCGCSRKDPTRKPNFVDLAGHKYGRLTVLGLVIKDKPGTHWLCKCDCGKTKILSCNDLRSHNTKSCGCLSLERKCLPKGEAAFNALYDRIKRASKREFSLTKEQVHNLIEQPCHYCGIPPSQEVGKKSNGSIMYNGIDRVDNARGYVIDNVVACCKYCNKSKNDRNIDEFKEWIERVYEYYIKPGLKN